MNLEQVMAQMALNARRVRELVADVDDEQARWKPAPDSWSILEVVCHLLDEERYDFRVRLDIMLHRPGDPWPPIDPQGWVTERKYNEQDLPTALAGYLEERDASLAWLRGLERPDWDAELQAPWGPFRAGDMMAAWAAHDLLHLRQLVELHRGHMLHLVEPYDTHYAGEW